MSHNQTLDTTSQFRMLTPEKAADFRVEERADGKKTLKGYAAVFNRKSEVLGWYREIIVPGAFRDCLKDKDLDVRALFNHDPNQVLARSTNKTLRMKEDETGLFCEIDLPDTTFARDLAVSIARGDISQMSFAFTILDAKWMPDEGEYVRHVLKVRRLYDVSPVTYPAYPDTSLGFRSVRENGVDLEKLFNAVLRSEQNLPLTDDEKNMIRTCRDSLDGLLGKSDKTPSGKVKEGRSIKEWREKIKQEDA